MLEFLIDKIFAMFGGRVFQQTVGIPMGTNCAPHIMATSFSGGRSQYPERTTDHGQATGKLYHLRLNKSSIIW
jgi:hypothetical protein